MRYKLLNDQAFAPTKVHESDAGFDVYAPSDVTIFPGKTCQIKLGIAIQIESDSVAIMSERSGMAILSSITSIGNIIDSGYRGEISIILVNLGHVKYHIERGHRIGQIVICKLTGQQLIKVDRLPDGDRGDNGYGSSGK